MQIWNDVELYKWILSILFELLPLSHVGFQVSWISLGVEICSPVNLDSKSLPADWASAVPVKVKDFTICEYARALHTQSKRSCTFKCKLSMNKKAGTSPANPADK